MCRSNPAGVHKRIRTSDPFVPNEVRYQAAPITECGAHLTAQIRPRQSLNSKMPFDRRESQQAS